MTVKLAGFNVDLENVNYLAELLSKDKIDEDEIENLKKIYWTPETISASYARISRDSRPICELRDEARKEVDKARKSNNAIIFTMGHSSIAEHAVFNIDIVGISRLLSETLEKSRLASFTEKSQRYIKIGEDICVPEEFKKDDGVLSEYKKITKELFCAYETIHEKLVPYFKEKYPVTDEKSSQYRDVVNLAKEDARYILPLGISTQVGMTANARTYEKLIRKLASSSLCEARELAKNIYGEIKNYAPSLVKYTDPTRYETETYKDLRDMIKVSSSPEISNEVELIKYDEEFEENFVASIILKTTNLPFQDAKEKAKNLSTEEKENIVKTSVKYLNPYDGLLREYESGGDFEFNILISATAFAQLKRHRLASLIDGDYSPKLGVTIPPSIKEVGLENFFNEKIALVDEFYKKLDKNYLYSRDYILTNAHRKNVYFKCNFRELVHVCRLRMDKHSQWDIRNIAFLMSKAVKNKYKFVGDFLTGKDAFSSLD